MTPMLQQHFLCITNMMPVEAVNSSVRFGSHLRSQAISGFVQRVMIGHAAPSEPKHVVHTFRSAESFSRQVSNQTVNEVTLHQLVIAPASQEAQQRGFAQVRAGL